MRREGSYGRISLMDDLVLVEIGVCVTKAAWTPHMLCFDKLPLTLQLRLENKRSQISSLRTRRVIENKIM
jgi:hypothetical protein